MFNAAAGLVVTGSMHSARNIEASRRLTPWIIFISIRIFVNSNCITVLVDNIRKNAYRLGKEVVWAAMLIIDPAKTSTS